MLRRNNAQLESRRTGELHMNNNKWWGVKAAAVCALASLLGPGSVGDAHGAYSDCGMCHLDPPPDSAARDYFDYFVVPQRRHPTGIAYPEAQNPDFFRPTAQAGDVAFFDRNGNGVADPDEVQLFGAGGMLECASCHREHGDAPLPAQPHMYLRVATDLLCLVCHRV
jgi:hypothetical protein